jgi:hypothetical protein
VEDEVGRPVAETTTRSFFLFLCLFGILLKPDENVGSSVSIKESIDKVVNLNDLGGPSSALSGS